MFLTEVWIPSAGYFQKTAPTRSDLGHFVVPGIVQRQKFPPERAQARLNFGPNQLLLILLLRFVAAREIYVHGAAGSVSAIVGSAVPHMSVHHNHGSGFSGDKDFAGYLCAGLRQFSPAVGSGNDAQRAIRFREIVEHPNGITDRVAVLVCSGATIRVQRLAAVRLRIGGPHVETREFEIPAEHRPDTFEYYRVFDGFFENCAFINAIGEAPRARLLFEFRAGMLSFECEQLFHSFFETRDLLFGDQAGKDGETVIAKPPGHVVGDFCEHLFAL